MEYNYTSTASSYTTTATYYLLCDFNKGQWVTGPLPPVKTGTIAVTNGGSTLTFDNKDVYTKSSGAITRPPKAARIGAIFGSMIMEGGNPAALIAPPALLLIIVGTFGTSLASVGAYAVMRGLFREYLVNTMRTLIFTTALPPMALAWTLGRRSTVIGPA